MVSSDDVRLGVAGVVIEGVGVVGIGGTVFCAGTVGTGGLVGVLVGTGASEEDIVTFCVL